SNEEAARTWLPSQVYDSLSQAQAAVRHLIDQYSDPACPRLGPYVLGIEHKDARTLIGHVGFSPWNGEVEIGFAVGRSYQGQGLAREAVVAASNWALRTFALERIVAVAAVANIASNQLLLRANFTH